jgi:chorismate mutase
MRNNKLFGLRKKIDLIDKKILRLLEQRVQIAEKIIKIKIENGLSITDRKRENEIIENLIRQTKNKILKKYLPQIYKIIFKISKEKYINLN